MRKNCLERPLGALSPILSLLATGLLTAASAAAETVEFRFDPGGEDVQSVSLRGDMNSWGEDPMEPGDGGVWSVTLELPPGEYSYKYFVNGQWPQDMTKGPGGRPYDAQASDYVDDGFGGQNAVRIVGGGGPGLKGRPDLGRRRAHWVSTDRIVWNAGADAGVELLCAANAGLGLEADGDGWRLTGEADRYPLAPAGPLDGAPAAKFPHLAGRPTWRLPAGAVSAAAELLRGQVIVARFEGDALRSATGLQIPGVLDELFATDEPLGPRWAGGQPELAVWAPTARNVELLLFANSANPAGEPARRVAMERSATGVWSALGRPDWRDQFYLFEVTVYQPTTQRLEVNRVTDPYSRSLATDGRMSHLVDLEDPAWMPEGWREFPKPSLASPLDISIYELHVRDFSALAEDVAPAERGTYVAFARDNAGTRHLRSLAEAGLTHVHLLPAFDFATVREDPADREEPEGLAGFPADSPEPQARVGQVRELDGFNWGYDPAHFGVPEGSYSTNADGAQRVREFRGMVQGLSELGLRVIMDVVYNHTHASGQNERSVFDRIVPGYYHRLNDDGGVETSTCCQNTASEHAMMERFLVDDLVHWARHYRVDGFRFDLMGHHMRANLEKVRAALDELTLSRDGIDGKSLYLYGEGWDFGEVQGGQRGVNASQGNMIGTRVGTFNDRFRDAVRGGNPFGDRREQGFATGRALDSNSFHGDGAGQLGALFGETDRVRAGLAGNLRRFEWTGRDGRPTTGSAHGAYGGHPDENVVYVAAHDNETFFDKIQYAAAESADLPATVRMQCLAISLTSLAQGVPFFHAGIELLRTKALDADSYDSGDWFNRLNFTYETNHFGEGLPPEWKNVDRWDVIGERLRRADRRPGKAEIVRTADHFREMLRIRTSSLLFRLPTADDVMQRVRFHNTGKNQKPGLIAMSISDAGAGLADLDPNVRRVMVLFNAAPEPRELRIPAGAPPKFELHEVQRGGSDPVVREAEWSAATRTFTVPARTTAVFVEPQN